MFSLAMRIPWYSGGLSVCFVSITFLFYWVQPNICCLIADSLYAASATTITSRSAAAVLFKV